MRNSKQACQEFTPEAIASARAALCPRLWLCKMANLLRARYTKGWWPMADLSINFAGIRSPNPFWLASAPPSNSGMQVHRAFEAGWGGAVWKTIGAPVLNVSNRYGAWHYRAVVVSAMVESKPEAWHDIIRRIQDTGADGIELNYGCPHGMSERGMGSAVGQVPEYCEQITRWVMEVAKIPVIVKLTPNISDIVMPARAAVAAGANAVSLINTLNSIIGVDLDTLEITPNIGGKGGHGGYAGPAVKPIALNMLAALGRDSIVGGAKMPISGMGGISTWRDAAEFLLLGAGSLQVCTAVMHYGFRIVEDLCDGLSNWMDDKGFASISDVVGRSLHRVSDFNHFDLSFSTVARIDQQKCIRCNLCYVACNDTAHQCIDLIAKDGGVVQPLSYDIQANGKEEAVNSRPSVYVREQDCVGCRLCYNVCPVEDCIRMIEQPSGRPPVTWGQLSESQPEVTEDWEKMQKYREKMGIHIH